MLRMNRQVGVWNWLCTDCDICPESLVDGSDDLLHIGKCMSIAYFQTAVSPVR